VIDHQAGIVIGDHARQLRLEGQAGRVVDDLGAQLDRALRHFGFVGVHRNRRGELPFQALQDGDEPPHLLRQGNARGAGPRGLGADIDDVRALFLQLQGAREGAVGIGVLAAVGEGVRCDVEDSHQGSALPELDLPLLQLPVEEFSHR